MEFECFGRQAKASGDGMAVEGVMVNDEEAWDDVRGGWLDREKVREARLQEVGYMREKRIWDEVPRSTASAHRILSVKLA